MRCDGKIALITGAGSGIGRALAIELSAKGAQLLLVGRRKEALEATKALLASPDSARIFQVDLTLDHSRESLVRDVSALGRLDFLFNNAGVVTSGPLSAAGAVDRRIMYETNLIAPIELTLALLPLLKAAAPSRIVNIGSMFGDIAFPYFSVYSATKFGLRGWSEALRRELSSQGIGVTYAAPRGTRTAATNDLLTQAFDMHLDEPQPVANSIVKAALKGKRDIYPCGPERLFLVLQRLFPSVIDGALVKQFKQAVSRLAIVAALTVLASPVFAQAYVDPPMDMKPLVTLDPKMGWYVAGKGGPSLAKITNIQSTNSYGINDTHAQNMIGAFGMAAGYEWSYRYHIPLRTEFEVMNRTEVTYNASPVLLGVSSGALASTVQNVTGMAKAYWHFPVNSANWWPFISGGLGMSMNTVKSQYTASGGTPIRNTHASEELAWSGGFGATFKLGPQVMNDVEIRYVDLGKANWGLPSKQNISTNGIGDFAATEISFAIRVMF